MEGNPFSTQQTDASNRTIESSAARARLAIGVMKGLRPVDADAEADLPFLEEIAPLLGDQHAIGLERVAKVDRRRAQLLDSFERRPIERNRQHQGFACMPDYRQV